MVSDNDTIISTANTNNSNLCLEHLPAYAKYILKHKPDVFPKVHLYFLKRIRLPILNLAGIDEEKLTAILLKHSRALLIACVKNKVVNVEKCFTEISSFISVKQITIDDIILYSLIQQYTFKEFINDYTSEAALSNNLL
ncbi:hypothetical protein [Parafilimonas sp.]|uniref:hypothetical protein n=1 Tax=Parafilimonas sp. TaxID=1969739 RepID=UPI0039E4B6BA